MYGGRTILYGIPFPKDGDTITEFDEKRRSQMIENLIRGAILAEGDTRVFLEGRYSSVLNDDNSVTVRLTGSPSIRGIARSGFVEYNGLLEWPSLAYGAFYYLYVKATQATYLNPGDITEVSSRIKVGTTDHLFLATLDNTKRGEPVLDTNPSGKAIGRNLFELLSDPTDPFGENLSQTNLSVTRKLWLTLAQDQSFLVKQVNRSSRRPVILIRNDSDQPEIKSVDQLRLADKNLTLSLTDEENANLKVPAVSLVGALNRIKNLEAVSIPEVPVLKTDASQTSFFVVKLTGNRKLAKPTNAYDGQKITWRIHQDDIGGHKLSLDSAFRFPSEIPPVSFSTGPKKTDYFEAVRNETSDTWDVVNFVGGF